MATTRPVGRRASRWARVRSVAGPRLVAPRRRGAAAPVPRVSVRNSVRKPIRPRAGTQIFHADPAGAVVDHLLQPALAARPSSWVIDAEVVFWARRWSAARPARGSCRRSPGSPPAACRRSSSKPSRRIMLDQDRPAAARRGPAPPRCPGRSVGRTRIETLPTSSAIQPVLHQPRGELVALTWPASGEVLMPIVIEIDGSSTVMTGSGSRVVWRRRASRRS